LIATLKTRGVEFAYVTLAVGEGTFKPVTAETLEEHRIHEERFSIDERNAGVINKTREKGGRIIAVGTTSVRVLETAAAQGQLSATAGATRLFIKPGYKFKIVDAMITNFHLPQSTLIALVGAFTGLDTILAAYRHAIEKRYRFYSYGDAMLII
jgi:S-adenosylmethionine:tRNA ribosyltransferase-isomerase